LPQHPAIQVNVVDLHRRCGGLMRLVKALQYRGLQPLRSADKPCRPPEFLSVDAADLGGAFGREFADPLAKLLESDCVLVDVVVVDPVVVDDLVQQAIHQREIGSRQRRQMHVAWRATGVNRGPDTDDCGWGITGQAVQHPGPQNGLRLSDVVAEQRNDIGVVDVV
jgi:hypothetical protein